jgi:acyl-homoserine lactone acylase PvdQ
MPYVINPDKGFVVNANNFVSSHNVKHGISLSAVFPHRKVRITEMIENLEGKATVEDMKSIQLDVLDI